MQLFITGTDTHVGKTIVSSWLCLHSNGSYFKPIQTGSLEDIDSDMVYKLSHCLIHKEAYIYKEPLAPYLTARLEKKPIDIHKIERPNSKNLIIEGAGGLMVPIDEKIFMIDLIDHLKVPVILVARGTLGTINHTLLSIEALRKRNIKLLGVIFSGALNHENAKAIMTYGKVKILAELPFLPKINKQALLEIPFSKELKKIFK